MPLKLYILAAQSVSITSASNASNRNGPLGQWTRMCPPSPSPTQLTSAPQASSSSVAADRSQKTETIKAEWLLLLRASTRAPESISILMAEAWPLFAACIRGVPKLGPDREGGHKGKGITDCAVLLIHEVWRSLQPAGYILGLVLQAAFNMTRTMSTDWSANRWADLVSIDHLGRQ